jgi:hypothetical protein
MLKLMFEWHVTYPHIICMFDLYIYKLIYICMLERLIFSTKKLGPNGLDLTYKHLKNILFVEYGWKCIPNQHWSKQKPLEIITYIYIPKYMSKFFFYRGHYVKELFVKKNKSTSISIPYPIQMMKAIFGIRYRHKHLVWLHEENIERKKMMLNWIPQIKENNVCNIANQVDHEVAKSRPSSTT